MVVPSGFGVRLGGLEICHDFHSPSRGSRITVPLSKTEPASHAITGSTSGLAASNRPCSTRQANTFRSSKLSGVRNGRWDSEEGEPCAVDRFILEVAKAMPKGASAALLMNWRREERV